MRLLAAIMFTDMVGYTALMQEDEEKALQNRNRQRSVFTESIAKHDGKILQFYGDGTLSIFKNAIEVVKSAIEIQQDLQSEPCVPLRIGIHTGDIVYDAEGIYGDSVNIASRIETIAKAGSVLISEKVQDEIKNHPFFKTLLLGEYEFKNIKRPMEVYALQHEGLVIPAIEDIQEKAKIAVQSIAVLPFVNLSADTENEYFSDGITEELINVLSKVEGIAVTSRTSSFVFKGKNEDIRTIGSKLNVKTILEGSVRKAGNRVRISAQLIDISNGFPIFSEVYERELENIFEIQDEIARNISNKLQEKLGKNKIINPLVKSATENPEAYNLYLKGLYYLNKWNADDIKKINRFF